MANFAPGAATGEIDETFSSSLILPIHYIMRKYNVIQKTGST